MIGEYPLLEMHSGTKKDDKINCRNTTVRIEIPMRYIRHKSEVKRRGIFQTHNTTNNYFTKNVD